MKCLKCKTDIADSFAFCPRCGERVVKKTQLATPVQRQFEHDISSFWSNWKITEQIMTDIGETVYKAIKCEDEENTFATVKVITVSPQIIFDDSCKNSDPDSIVTACRNAVDCIMNEIYLTDALGKVGTIVRIDDFKVIEKPDETKWEVYIRMDYVMPLDLYISDKMLSEQEIIKLGCDICSALEICENRKIIHSNIYPGNILVDRNDNFFLDGFKAENLLRNVTKFERGGTFNYTAPEMFNSIKYTSKVDTYSLGIVMYTLLNRNRIPFLNPTKQLLTFAEKRNAVRRRLEGELIPPPLDASPELAEIILRACAFKAADRFESASEMKNALIAISKKPYTPIPEKEEEETPIQAEKDIKNKGIRRLFSSK